MYGPKKRDFSTQPLKKQAATKAACFFIPMKSKSLFRFVVYAPALGHSRLCEPMRPLRDIIVRADQFRKSLRFLMQNMFPIGIYATGRDRFMKNHIGLFQKLCPDPFRFRHRRRRHFLVHDSYSEWITYVSYHVQPPCAMIAKKCNIKPFFNSYESSSNVDRLFPVTKSIFYHNLLRKNASFEGKFSTFFNFDQFSFPVTRAITT